MVGAKADTKRKTRPKKLLRKGLSLRANVEIKIQNIFFLKIGICILFFSSRYVGTKWSQKISLLSVSFQASTCLIQCFVQTYVEKGKYKEIFSTTSLEVAGPVEFTMDLVNSFSKIECKIVKSNSVTVGCSHTNQLSCWITF